MKKTLKLVARKQGLTIGTPGSSLKELKKLKTEWVRERKAHRTFQRDFLQQVYSVTLRLFHDTAERALFLDAAGQVPSSNGPPIEMLFRLVTEFCEATGSKKVSQKHARALTVLYHRGTDQGSVATVLKDEGIERLARLHACKAEDDAPVAIQHTARPTQLRLPLPPKVLKQIKHGKQVKLKVIIDSDTRGEPVLRKVIVLREMAQHRNISKGIDDPAVVY